MASADRVRVVEHGAGAPGVPGVGEQGEQAALVVDGQTLMRGNRSRLVLLAAKLSALFAYELNAGRTPHAECVVLKRPVAAHARARYAWTPVHDGWLHAAVPFGSIVVTGIWVDGERSLLSLSPVRFPPRARIETELLNPHSADTSAELVLLASVARRPTSSRP